MESLNTQLEQLDTLIAVKADLQNIYRELEKNTVEKADLDRKSEAARGDETRLIQHEKLSNYQGDLKLYEKSKSNSKQLGHQLKTLQEQQSEASRNVDQLLQEISELIGHPVAIDKVNTALNQFEQAVLELDRLKNEKRQLGVDQRAQINHLAGQYHLSIPDRIAPKEALAMLADDQAQLIKKLADAGLNDQRILSECKNQQKQHYLTKKS